MLKKNLFRYLKKRSQKTSSFQYFRLKYSKRCNIEMLMPLSVWYSLFIKEVHLYSPIFITYIGFLGNNYFISFKT